MAFLRTHVVFSNEKSLVSRHFKIFHPKMQGVYAVLLFAAILVQGDADITCKLPTPVEKFAASYYTAMIVGHDPDIVDTLSVSGDEAAMLFQPVARNSLNAFKYRKCDDDEMIFITSLSLSFVANLTLPIYFKMVARTVGSILDQFNVLNCNNAVPLALEFLTYNREDAEEYKLDPHKFDTYMHEILFGAFKLYKSQGLKLEMVLQPTADVYHQLSTEDKKAKQNCVG